MTGTTKTARKPAGKAARKTETVIKQEKNKSYRLPAFKPENQTQRELFNSVLTSPLSIAVGPAGTGKSFVGAYAAARLLIEKHVDKIILTRNPLPTGTSLGFFSGSGEEKMAVWLGPIIGTLKKILKTANDSDGFFTYLVEQKKIEYQPLETIKGSSFDNTFIIVEEAQELSHEQLKTLTTRIGDNSHLFLNGDYAQSNSRNRGEAALKELVQLIKEDHEYLDRGFDLEEWENIRIPVIEFSEEDIVRSDITRKMVHLFSKSGSY